MPLLFLASIIIFYPLLKFKDKIDSHWITSSEKTNEKINIKDVITLASLVTSTNFSHGYLNQVPMLYTTLFLHFPWLAEISGAFLSFTFKSIGIKISMIINLLKRY